MLSDKEKQQLSTILVDVKTCEQLLETGRILGCSRKLQSLRCRLVNLIISSAPEISSIQESLDHGVHQT